MEYEKTLLLKTKIVQNLIDKTFGNSIQVKNTIGMENPYHYRNKAQYPIGYDRNGNITTGIFASRSHEIIEVQDCKIQEPISEYIVKQIVQFLRDNNISAYREETRAGFFRHIVIKIGKKTNEIMCILVINGEKFLQEQKLVEHIIKTVKQKDTRYTIKTIVKNINTKNTNVILGNKNITLYGDGYIHDNLGEYIFKISPMSFYQTNPIQTEILYSKAIEGAKLEKEDIVLDLYCGIGTIGIFASKYVKQVYGIEIVEQAVIDAKENAKINNVRNIEFLCGDVGQVIISLLNEKQVTPNVIFVDPPRRGLDENAILHILKIKPKKLIYISCNPATMVIDLKKLEESYYIKEIQPVDMFPFTSHVECCSVLYLKN